MIDRFKAKATKARRSAKPYQTVGRMQQLAPAMLICHLPLASVNLPK